MNGMYKGVGGWWERVGSQKQVKPSIKTHSAVLCAQRVTETDTIYRRGWDCHWHQFGTSCTLINALQWLPRPCGAPLWMYVQGQQKAICESRPSHLWLCTWCDWTVGECSFNVKSSIGIQFLWQFSWFLKIQSHLLIISVFCLCDGIINSSVTLNPDLLFNKDVCVIILSLEAIVIYRVCAVLLHAHQCVLYSQSETCK